MCLSELVDEICLDTGVTNFPDQKELLRRSWRNRVNVCRLPHKEIHMATNLAIDPDLLDRAVEVSGERTKKAAVTKALQEFIARREQRRVAELFGKLEWDDTYNYKAERSRRS